MKTWEKYGLKPFSSATPGGVFAIVTFAEKLHPLLLARDEAVIGEVTKSDAIELAIEAGMSNIIVDMEPDSSFGPRPHGYPAKAVRTWFVDADSAGMVLL